MSDPAPPIDWKARATKLEAELRAAADKLERARSRRAAVLERLHRYERAHLDPVVLEHLLASRAAARHGRPLAPAAEEHEALHLASCDAYRAAVQQPATPAGADHVRIAGLDFWVPRDERGGRGLSDRVVRDRWLPLAQILQTREAVGGGTMLDIGANIGTTTIPRAVLGDYCLFYCAEPDADNFSALVSAVVSNGLRGIVMPDRCAISDRDGAMRLRRAASIGGHSLDDTADDGVEVPVFTLRSWMDRLHVDVGAVRFVKVDTQGRECHVLAGAGPLLERAGVVWQIEFSPADLASAGRTPADLIALVQRSFTWFIDLYAMAPGARVRPIGELPEALGYLGESFTDLLLYRAATA